ncbi:MAG: hypothetical protein F6K40_35835 [Okeania sp. SIO3I5]|nr:hypothetical protein [Okeania sp. SIO3I5]
MIRTYAEPPYTVGANGIRPLQIAFCLGICVSPDDIVVNNFILYKKISLYE